VSWVGGFMAGVGAVTLGILIGQSGHPSRRHHHRRRQRQFYVRRRSGFNPGYRRRLIECEMLAFLREARETLAVMNNPKSPSVDAEFIVDPGTANASPKAQEPMPEAKKEK
jgi:hypothetical protein